MNLQRTLLLATGLFLAACSGSTTQASTGDPSVPAETLTVLVVEASGGG
jgi:hypothetical protein